MKMEYHREQCVMEGKLLGKYTCVVSHFALTVGVLARLLSVDAEEAQSKIEELRD